MVAQTKKVVIGISFNSINDNTNCKVLALMNMRAKIIETKTSNFKPKLLAPDEFEKNKEIKNGKIATALKMLLPLAKIKDDYLPLLLMLECNIKNLDILFQKRVDLQSIKKSFMSFKEKANVLDYRVFKEELFKEEERLAKNYRNSFINLHIPDFSVLDEIKKIIRLNSIATALNFQPRIVNLNDTEDFVHLILVSYITRGFITINEFTTITNNIINIKEGEEMVNKITAYLEKENAKKEDFYFVDKNYNRTIAFKLNKNDFNNYILLIPYENQMFFYEEKINKGVDLAEKDGFAKIINVKDLAKTIYLMINSLALQKQQAEIKNIKDKQNEKKDEKNIKEIIGSFFNENKTT